MRHVVMKRAFRLTSVLCATVCVAACAVGPDSKPPIMADKIGYQAQSVKDTVGAAGSGFNAAQHFAQGSDVSGTWWEIFGNAQLNALVLQALDNNQTLHGMQDALKAAWEQRRVEGASLYPSVSGQLMVTRNKTSYALSNVPFANEWLYNLHTLQLNIGYVPDLWGGNRRAIQASGADADVQRFQVEATALTMITNLVESALQEASLRAQIDATTIQIETQRHTLRIISAQNRLGDMSQQDIAAQTASVAQLEASLPPLQQQLEQTRHQIAVLVGQSPDAPLPVFTLDKFTLPAQLPLTVPSDLLNQRPDIRAAQAQIDGAAARVGVAIANRLPNVQLSALPGQVVGKFTEFFTPSFSNWFIGATLTQPIFQGGSLLHAEREARDNLLQANELYKATVLSAVQNVADTLSALQADAAALQANQKNFDAATKSLKIAQAQLRLGDVSVSTLLQAQQAQAQARVALVQAQGARFSDSVALFQSLGGGWWHRNDLGMTPKEQKKLGKSLVPW
ncbi:efflux transporter outer membrane subunit [Neokomagataea thailandica]|uniref:Outer membrane channel lipoprotein n=1 Tax=Neokomagataea tanensis NBRC 106556 TaxID=1223519 RepID=A0ABQ0QG48_9PROT|nr:MULTISPECIES: efflux transporter outer membrane subunit [Neokomagataea]GBR43477.1 outer membrane channel lipoprotein [Neokomagataea tanensis NBRC 106556]